MPKQDRWEFDADDAQAKHRGTDPLEQGVPARLSATALKAASDVRYARPRRARTIVIGDSLDAAVGGWYTRLSAISGQTLTYQANAGIGGQTTTQYLARIATDVIAQAPDVCIIGGTTNDHSQGVPEATTRANYQAMTDLLRAAGIFVVVRNTPPCDLAGSVSPWNTIALRRAVIQRHNNWLDGWAHSQGIPVLDIYSPLVDPTTGGYRAAIAGDGTHPNDQGYQDAAAGMLAAGLPSVFSGQSRLSGALAEDGNLISNGVFIGDTNADGLANNWASLGSGATFSLVAGTSPVLGNWQRIVTTGAAGVTVYADTNVAPIPGHRYVALCRARLTSGAIRLRLGNTSGTGGLTLDYGPLATAGFDGIMRLELVLPAGAVGANLRVQVAAPNAVASDVQFAQITVRDLGLA